MLAAYLSACQRWENTRKRLPLAGNDEERPEQKRANGLQRADATRGMSSTLWIHETADEMNHKFRRATQRQRLVDRRKGAVHVTCIWGLGYCSHPNRTTNSALDLGGHAWGGEGK